MRTFTEFLNAQPQNLKGSWERVETTWEDFVTELRYHLHDNGNKYDSHHAKFGNLTSEHPDQSLNRVIRQIEKEFKNMKASLNKLGAYQMI